MFILLCAANFTSKLCICNMLVGFSLDDQQCVIVCVIWLVMGQASLYSVCTGTSENRRTSAPTVTGAANGY
jgi:hypothetical protein